MSRLSCVSGREVVRRASNPVWIDCRSRTVSTSPECSDEGIWIYNLAFDRNGIHTDMATNVGAGLDSARDLMEGGARMTVLLDRGAGGDVRRSGLYDGDIYVGVPTLKSRVKRVLSGIGFDIVRSANNRGGVDDFIPFEPTMRAARAAGCRSVTTSTRS